MDFLEDRIITRFGVPARITTDNAKAFSSTEFSSFCFKYGITLSHSSNYYPQGNGQAESSNKNFMTIVKKIVGDNKRSWDSKIKFALWTDRITKKGSTRKSPFELVYGLDVTLPVHLKLPMYQLLQAFSTNQNAVQNRMNQLIELDENKRKAFDHSLKNQDKVKKAFDKSYRERDFQVGDTVLLSVSSFVSECFDELPLVKPGRIDFSDACMFLSILIAILWALAKVVGSLSLNS